MLVCFELPPHQILSFIIHDGASHTAQTHSSDLAMQSIAFQLQPIAVRFATGCKILLYHSSFY